MLLLPNELILLLLPTLYESEINALCQTTRRLYNLLNPLLYKHSVTNNGGYTLEWAAIHGQTSTARLILQAGTAPDASSCEFWQPFALAALHGHKDMIELLCAHGIDPCATNTDWKTHQDEDVEDWVEGHPLSLAASGGHLSVVALLLEYGVCPDLWSGDHERQTALHLAAEKGHIDVVRLLVDAGSAIDMMNGHGATPLGLAAKNSHLHVVQYLLSRGASGNTSTEDKATPLCMASRSGNVAIVQCLLDHGACLNPSTPLYQLAWTAEGCHDKIVDLLLQRFDYIEICTAPHQQAVLLCVAALCGRLDLLRRLLEDQAYDPDFRVSDGRIFMPANTYYVTPTTAISWAAERGQLGAVEMLLAHGASIPRPTTAGMRFSDLGPLLRATKKGHERIVATLLDHGADPNTKGPAAPALFAAIAHPRVVKVLLDRGADPTILFRGQSLLSRVASSGNIDSLRILLDHGLDLVDPVPVARGPSGLLTTSLLRAAIHGGEGMVRFLLERGLSPSRSLDDSAAEQCLLPAARSGSTALVQLLLDIGFDAHLGDVDGYFLYRAATAEVGAGAIVDFLLQHGCDIEATGGSGRTAVGWAAHLGNKETLEVLLARGANPLYRSGRETPLSMAAGKGHLEIVRCLLRSFDEQGLSLDDVKDHLRLAEEDASGVDRGDIVRVVRQYYWRKRYPLCLAS